MTWPVTPWKKNATYNYSRTSLATVLWLDSVATVSFFDWTIHCKNKTMLQQTFQSVLTTPNDYARKKENTSATYESCQNGKRLTVCINFNIIGVNLTVGVYFDAHFHVHFVVFIWMCYEQWTLISRSFVTRKLTRTLVFATRRSYAHFVDFGTLT